MFRALVVEKDAAGATSAGVQELSEDRLPDGDVTVAVEFSTLNYKDGLCLGSGGGLVRTWPHVPGIDLAGVVESSDDARYRPGARVVLTGWRVGEVHWGGYATRARVKADWLVPLPASLSTRMAMAVGTAGFTSMLAVIALEDHGLRPDQGEVLVTGAAGGVGSVAVALLAKLGYAVAAVTGRPETEAYLRDLGAARIVPRADLAETVKRPLESETWAGCIDSVGGAMLARVLGQMKMNASVAAVGLAVVQLLRIGHVGVNLAAHAQALDVQRALLVEAAVPVRRAVARGRGPVEVVFHPGHVVLVRDVRVGAADNVASDVAMVAGPLRPALHLHEQQSLAGGFIFGTVEHWNLSVYATMACPIVCVRAGNAQSE